MNGNRNKIVFIQKELKQLTNTPMPIYNRMVDTNPWVLSLFQYALNIFMNTCIPNTKYYPTTNPWINVKPY